MAGGKIPLVILPDEEPESGIVCVDGSIGGIGYRFLLDTGASKTVVKQDATTSTLSPVGRYSSSGLFAEAADDLVEVPGIAVGQVSKRDFQIVRSCNPGLPWNLLGMDFLGSHRLSLSFRDLSMSLEPSGIGQEGAALARKLQLDARRHPYLETAMGGHAAQAVFDTGANMTVIDLRFIQSNRGHFQAVGESQGTDSSGTRQNSPLFRISGLEIGGHEFPPHCVAGADLSHVNRSAGMHLDMVLGYSTMRRADWLLDFPAAQWEIVCMES